jgi:hypothetical protein
MNINLLTGLKRASWLFAAIAGVIAMIISAYECDYFSEALLLVFFSSLIAFLVFRLGIWVAKGFIEPRRPIAKESETKPPKNLENPHRDIKEKLEAVFSKKHRNPEGPASVLTFPGFKVVTVGFSEDEVMLLASYAQAAACEYIGKDGILPADKIPQVVLIDQWQKTLLKTTGKWKIFDIKDDVTKSGVVGFQSVNWEENNPNKESDPT